MRSGLRCVSFGLVMACVVAFPARAQEEDAKKQAVSCTVDKRLPKEGERTVQVLMSERKPSGRRPAPFAVRVGTSARLAVADVDAALREIKPHYGAQEEQYRAWVRGEVVEERVKAVPGTLRLAGLDSKLDLTCPRSVQAGRPIEVKITSVGQANITWHIYIIYPTPSDDVGDAFTDKMLMKPDAGAYEMQAVVAGEKVEGAVSKVIRYNTYPADRNSYLGVRIENPKHVKDGQTFWVKVR